MRWYCSCSQPLLQQVIQLRPSSYSIAPLCRHWRYARILRMLVVCNIYTTLINGIILTYSFEMIFSRQPSAGNAKKQIEKILTFFNWSWDFKNVVTLIIFLWLIGYYCINSFWVFYQTYISTSLLDDEHLNIVLNQVFTLIETKPINTTFIIHSSNILAELSLYLNLF